MHSSWRLSKITAEYDTLNGEISLMTHKLKERIVRSLEASYKRTRKNEPVCWRGIWIELGVGADEFCNALDAAAKERAIIFADSDHIKLPNTKGRAENKLRQRSTASLGTDDPVPLTTSLLGYFVRLRSQRQNAAD